MACKRSGVDLALSLPVVGKWVWGCERFLYASTDPTGVV
jgi:hypothetical protein